MEDQRKSPFSNSCFRFLLSIAFIAALIANGEPAGAQPSDHAHAQIPGANSESFKTHNPRDSSDIDPYLGKRRHISGLIEGNGNPQPGYKVSLYVIYAGDIRLGRTLATTRTGQFGKFHLKYRQPYFLSPRLKPLYFIIAEKGPAMLASALGNSRNLPKHIVVNERTTVATATSFAQFIHGRNISGNTYGLLNAARMAANMANPITGDLGAVLANAPNGTDTSTLKTLSRPEIG